MRITSNTHLDYPEKTLYGALKSAAQASPKGTALDFFDRKISFRSFLEDIDTAAAALAARGVKKNDIVTLCMPNTPQALICFYALSRLGAAANMLHPQSAQNEIRFALELSGSRLILTLDMFYESVIAAVRDMGGTVSVIVSRMEDELPLAAAAAYMLSSGRKYLSFPYSGEGELWRDFMKSGKTASLPEETPFSPEHTAVILYSGGTSGTPKGICLSDYAFNACAVQAAAAIDMPFEPGCVMLSCMPCFHGFGLGMNLHAALIHGVSCVLMPSFDIKTYSRLLVQKRPNYIAGVPTIFEALLNIPALNLVRFPFLRGMFCGGDTLPVPLKKKVDDFLKEHGASIQIREGYGLTESVTASCLTPRDEYREGSIGLPFPDTDYAIVKPGSDEFLPAGETGEIIMTGPTLMQGYLNNPEESADCLRTLPDGRTWLYTGDLGSIDADGFVYFRGRIKRMIITNGYNVYPAELERILEKCPGVKEVCVIGVKDPRRMQKIRAVIVPEADTPESVVKAAAKELLRLNIARYAHPREFVFRSDLPKTEIGKTDWKALEAEAAAEAGM